METTDVKYVKKIFLFEKKDYRRVLYYLNEVALNKEEIIGRTFYFLDKKKVKIIKANIFKKTFEFTKNFDKDFFNELEKIIIKNGSN